MQLSKHWVSPVEHLQRVQPDYPVLYFCPAVLLDTVRDFIKGFPGLVTYAVKANPHSAVLANINAAGITAFDVASPAEMALILEQAPQAKLHYNNPVRSTAEVETARQMHVTSWSVDEFSELEKLRDLPKGTEIAVRLALPLEGAAYHFGAKFGAPPALAARLLAEVDARGYSPSLCFHPGTQCSDPAVWSHYIATCADVAREAAVRIARLNVGGGFPSHRGGQAPDLVSIFKAIDKEIKRSFPIDRPQLLCEPGRALVSEAFTLACRIKAFRDNASVFLNDGIYGALAEARDMEPLTRLKVVSPDGRPRLGVPVARQCFGPTCDSIDCLPKPIALPRDTLEGDYVLFSGIGAYSMSLATRFNGYGLSDPQTVTVLQ